MAVTALLIVGLVSTAFAADFPLRGVTEAGRYRVELMPENGHAPIAEIHSWSVRLTTRDGEAFVPLRLGLSGRMPGHGHGMQTEPRVTRQREDGAFVVEGMKFHMGGEWKLIVGVDGPVGMDTATFALKIATGVDNINVSVPNWPAAELALMQSLTLTQLKSRTDPSNRFSNNQAAAQLGRRLFFDKELSAEGDVACSTCHDPELAFTDGRKTSFGTAVTTRNAPTLIGASHSRWFYWDGRRDSLWAQAITPLESRGEMDNNRSDIVRLVARKYAKEYAAITGTALDEYIARVPAGAGPYADSNGKSSWDKMSATDRSKVNTAYANVGKFLAAYMETLQPEPSRFDAFVETMVADGYPAAKSSLSVDEQRGLKLFLDGARTQCLRCHNGPLFTNYGFHNIATGTDTDGIRDFGRMIGLQAAQIDPFNCLGDYSDATPDACSELRFAQASHGVNGAFKVPGLRNVAETAPYMHDGRFATLEQVVEFYTETPGPEAGRHELPPLNLSAEEVKQLAAFLASLSSAMESD